MVVSIKLTLVAVLEILKNEVSGGRGDTVRFHHQEGRAIWRHLVPCIVRVTTWVLFRIIVII